MEHEFNMIIKQNLLTTHVFFYIIIPTKKQIFNQIKDKYYIKKDNFYV